MEPNSRIDQFVSRISDKLNDQVWFQQLKSKWDELDSKNRTYIKFGSIIGGVLLVFIILISYAWSVHSLKKELAEKSQLLSLIQSANDEMRKLREASPSGSARGGQPDAPWNNYFETIANTAGIEKGSITISPEKPAVAGDTTKESLFDISVKHVNIKQVVRYAYFLENGVRPVKLRNLSIDTKSDPSGYMDATLSISAFTLKPQGS